MKTSNNSAKTMRRNRRFKIFLIWLGEVNALMIAKMLASKIIETELVIVIVKCVTIMAAVAITGFSGVHMMENWANGRGSNNTEQLPKPSEEEEETQ